MKLCPEEGATVKECVAVIDPEVLTARASEGLLELSMELGLEVLRQMLEADAEVLAGPKG